MHPATLDMTARVDAPSPLFLDGPAMEDIRYAAPKASHFMLSLICSCALHLFVLFSPVFGTASISGLPYSESSQDKPSRLAVTLPASRMITAQDWHPSAASPWVPSELQAAESRPVAIPAPNPVGPRAATADLSPLPVAVYYPTSLLTVRPQPVGEADLDPPQLRPIVASGKVRLTLWIKPSGEALKVAVESTDLPQYFVDVAVGAFERLRFKPGELHGLRVGVVMRIEVTYDDGRMIKTEIAR
jgi:hypothetical protein